MSAPERIYLQGTAGDEFLPDGITWCWHQIEDDDVEYVRADKYETLRNVLSDIVAAGPIKEDEYPLLMARAKAALGGGA
jgi:hypothetical protein